LRFAQEIVAALAALCIKPGYVHALAYIRVHIRDIDTYFKSIHEEWRQANRGALVAIEKVRLHLIHQHLRQGGLARLKPASRKSLATRTRAGVGRLARPARSCTGLIVPARQAQI
jgi:hypothetical protein